MTVATIEPHAPVELVQHVDPGQNLIVWAQALSSAHKIATALCHTSFVPRHFAGKPEEAAAALMLGDELGLAPVSALRSIFVIGGTPGMYAKTMVALVQSRGHEVWTESESPTKVTVCGRRNGSDKVEKSEWTLDRARRAGYTNNKKYETTPEDMLYARAAATVCRRIAADVLAGIPYSVEELELETETQPVKTIRRKVEAVAPPEPEIDSPAPVGGVEGQDGEEPTPSPSEPDLEHDGITSAQLKNIGRLCTELGLKDRDAALLYVADVIGRKVSSRNDLTKDEASRVIDAMAAEADTQGGQS